MNTINVFSRFVIQVERKSEQWMVFKLGNDGKKNFLRDVVIPNDLPENEIATYIKDLFHEYE